jgi:hypothetical protein
LSDFTIFEKRFTITRTFILVTIFNICLITPFLIIYVLNEKNSDLITFFALCLLPTFMIGFILKLLNKNKIKKLKGKLNGKLVFSENEITISDRTIYVSEIKKMKILASDWVGRDAFNSREWNFENGLSNGVYNFLKITYENGNTEKVQFQVSYRCQFKKLRNIIEHYYFLNKIDYLNCVDLLCLSTKDEWNELKKIKLQPTSHIKKPG